MKFEAQNGKFSLPKTVGRIQSLQLFSPKVAKNVKNHSGSCILSPVQTYLGISSNIGGYRQFFGENRQDFGGSSSENAHFEPQISLFLPPKSTKNY